MKQVIGILLTIWVIILFVGCEQQMGSKEEVVEELDTTIYGVNTATNKWIWDDLDLHYLWKSQMPEFRKTNESPNAYFNSLLYKTKDRWSYITENYKELVNSFKGIEKAMGYSLALFYKDRDNYEIVAYVEFVYPNTPASRAGVKRGDIIGYINGQILNLDNYVDLLFNTDDQRVGFLKEGSSGYEIIQGTKHLIAEEILENPVVKDTTLSIGNTVIGYLAYMGFIANFNDDLDDVFEKFINAGVNELVVDLRYNPGGGLNAANYLCSSIAPKAIVEQESRLVNLNWNYDLEQYIRSQNWTDNLYLNMLKDTKFNLDLKRVFFLTTGGSASASELTIAGLDPYMDVVTIGETTHGKYTASITLPDNDSLWAMQPIVIKYSNSVGVTDFEDGFAPDYPVEDSFGYDLGDWDDPMMAKAIEVISGSSNKSTKVLKSAHPKLSYIGSAGRNRIIQDGILDVTDNLNKDFFKLLKK